MSRPARAISKRLAFLYCVVACSTSDAIDTPHVALISQSLAAERWPNEDPIGRTIEFGNMDGDLRLLTIVGVVGDIRDHSLEAAPRATIYVNWRQRPQS